MKIKGLTIVLFFYLLSIGISMSAQDVTKIRLVYNIPDMERVQIKHEIVYGASPEMKLNMDAYYPPSIKSDDRLPAVILVLGYPDNALETKVKDWEIYISWGKLIVASGMVAINYETQHPGSDLESLISFVRQNASSLKIDENRIGIWSCSANVLTAMTILMSERRDYIKCAALYYGIFLTPDQKYRDAVLALAEKYKFSTEGIERIQYFHKDLPLFIVRAGQDMEQHQLGDYFVSTAISKNSPLTFINYSEGRHGFDAYDDNNQSREIVKATLYFLSVKLGLAEKDGNK